MKKRLVQNLTGILLVVLTAGSVVLSGCSSSGNAGTDMEAVSGGSSEAQAEQKNGIMPEMDENAIFGKVTGLEGDTITVALAEAPGMGERPDRMPENEKDSGNGTAKGQESGDTAQTAEGMSDADSESEVREEGENEEQRPNLPDGAKPEDGNRPDGAELPEGGMQMELTLTGEEQTIQVTEETSYTVNGKEGTLEDIQVDDILTIVLAEDGTAESVQAGMGGGPGGNGGGPAGKDGEKAEGDSASAEAKGALEVTDSQMLGLS